MKNALVVFCLAAGLLFAGSASADGRHGHGWNRHVDNGYYRSNHWTSGYNYRGGNRGYYNSRYYGYNAPRYRGNYVNISLGSHHRHRDYFSTGSFVGGLVLGSVLSTPRSYPSYSYRTPVVRQSSVTVINRTPAVSQPVTTGRRLLRDLAGRCYEINRDGAGNETRIELDPSACNF